MLLTSTLLKTRPELALLTVNAEGNRTAFESGHYFMANTSQQDYTTKKLTYPLLHLGSLLFSTGNFIFNFFLREDERE